MPEMNPQINGAAVACGLIGTILAIVISWSVNKHILWAALHGLCGWLYVIYYALGYGH